jgi:hypothetical protein
VLLLLNRFRIHCRACCDVGPFPNHSTLPDSELVFYLSFNFCLCRFFFCKTKFKNRDLFARIAKCLWTEWNIFDKNNIKIPTAWNLELKASNGCAVIRDILQTLNNGFWFEENYLMEHMYCTTS